MVLDINKKLRYGIEQQVDYLQNRGCTVKKACRIITEKIYDKSSYYFNKDYNNPTEATVDQERNIFYLYLNLLSGIAYYDAYKEYSYKLKHQKSTDTDMNILDDLSRIIDLDEVTILPSTNPDLFSTMLESVYNFNISNGLSKVIQVRSLDEKETDKVKTICSTYEEDNQNYGTSNQITLERLIKNYIGIQNKLKKDDIVDFEEFTDQMIKAFLKELIIVDNNNGYHLLLELAKNDYTVSKYLMEFVGEQEEMIKHIDFYAKENDEDIVNRLIYDDSFLSDAIYMGITTIANEEYLSIGIDNHKSITDDVTRKLTITNKTP